MPAKDKTSVVFSATTAAQIADLSGRWGPVKPLSASAVIEEAVRRVWLEYQVAEQPKPRKKS